MQPSQHGFGVVGSMVWGGWAEEGDAAMAAWFGLDVQRWDMQPWQHGLGEWADVADAAITVVQP
jgi:hypothetical protein